MKTISPNSKGEKPAAKRPRRTKAQTAKQTSAEEILQDDLELLETLGQHGATVVQHMWTCQKLLRRHEIDVDSICSSVVGIASALGQILPIIAKNHDRLAIRTKSQLNLAPIGQEKTELSCLMIACARAWNLILMALDKLEEHSPGSRRSGIIIFECVKLASAALDAIKLAAQQAAWKMGTRPASETIQESIAARNIAHLLATFVGYLGKDNAVHHKLFDGIAYILLERVGEQLYHCTFGRPRGATIEGRIVKPPEPEGAHEIALEATEATIVRLEVKALVVVLERVIGVAPLHANEQSPRKAKASLARTITMKSVSSTRTKLSLLAQDRLQRTLIACTFGNKINDDFVDILTKPVNMGRPPPVPKIKDEDVPEWYQTQVWRLVGWEILEKAGGWL
ncbi:hypothetical protein N0V90_001272 [Kalmusia sp. IMI 367209]|nr:hypothetical protein N0V90_001272 [Kalmusia sp. IMI 367209]